jgi:hypothetical protein
VDRRSNQAKRSLTDKRALDQRALEPYFNRLTYSRRLLNREGATVFEVKGKDSGETSKEYGI